MNQNLPPGDRFIAKDHEGRLYAARHLRDSIAMLDELLSGDSDYEQVGAIVEVSEMPDGDGVYAIESVLVAIPDVYVEYKTEQEYLRLYEFFEHQDPDSWTPLVSPKDGCPGLIAFDLEFTYCDPQLLAEAVGIRQSDLVITRLNKDPFETDVDIEEALQGYPCETQIVYRDEEDLEKLITLFTIVGAVCRSVQPPTDGEPGRAIVGHCENVDPKSLAQAAGFNRADDDGDDEEGSEDDVDDCDDAGEEGDVGAVSSDGSHDHATERDHGSGGSAPELDQDKMQAPAQVATPVRASQPQPPASAPLNQKLHDRITAAFGKPAIIKRGIPMDASYRTDPVTNTQRLEIRQYGESYLIECPYCNSGNLSIPHGFGEMDPVSNWPRVFLAKCFGKDCLKDKGRPTELHRKLFGHVNARATI